MAFLNKLKSKKNTSKTKLSEEDTISQPPAEVIVPSNLPNSNGMTASHVEEVLIPSITDPDEVKEPVEEADKKSEDEGTTVEKSFQETLAECPACVTVLNGLHSLKDSIQNLPPEYKEAFRLSGLVVLSLFGFFFSIVSIRFIRRVFFHDDNGFFCTYFAGPFCPLFDALCSEHRGYVDEYMFQWQALADELANGVSSFLDHIFKGFGAFVTIFYAIFGGVIELVRSGYHELVENVSENVSYLIRFCGDLLQFFINFILSSICLLFDCLAIGFHSIRDFLLPAEPPTYW